MSLRPEAALPTWLLLQLLAAGGRAADAMALADAAAAAAPHDADLQVRLQKQPEIRNGNWNVFPREDTLDLGRCATRPAACTEVCCETTVALWLTTHC